MPPLIYLDNNATTMMAPEVRVAMEPYFSIAYGNPSSVYSLGSRARFALEEAREKVAKSLGLNNARGIIFTSGGTEGNNTAIRSALSALPEKKKLVVSRVEHSSVKVLCEQLEKNGYEVAWVDVNPSGGFNWEKFSRALTSDTALVSMMWANNETGVIFPIREIAQAVKRSGALFHVDAVQAVGKLPINLGEIEADFFSFSAHKFHGPKGVGALWLRDDVAFHPLLVGGHQERDRRAGTENVPGAIAMAHAVEFSSRLMSQITAQVCELRDQLESGILDSVPDSFANGSQENRLPNTTNISFPHVKAEVLVPRLSEEGICVSGGSACLTGALEPSHVLMAMGHSRDSALSSVRFSLSRFNTTEEIDRTLRVIGRLVQEVKTLSRAQAG